MHKILLNTLHLKMILQPDGPILIKSGSESASNPILPDMNFVRSIHPNSGEPTIYLPGASLKGVIRSHAERIARTLGVDACDPLDTKESCGVKFAKTPVTDVYHTICPICRTFGHMVMASRFFVQDAYPSEAMTLLPIRQMVAIDRRSGSSVNTFTMEVATEGKFVVNITLRNFERWQVGLIALVLRDLREGALRIGFGKSRGLGLVKLAFDELHLHYTGAIADEDPRLSYVCGTYQLGSPHVHQNYHLLARETMPAESDFVSGELTPPWSGFGTEIRVVGDSDIEHVLKAQVSDWQQFVQERATS